MKLNFNCRKDINNLPDYIYRLICENSIFILNFAYFFFLNRRRESTLYRVRRHRTISIFNSHLYIIGSRYNDILPLLHHLMINQTYEIRHNHT